MGEHLPVRSSKRSAGAKTGLGQKRENVDAHASRIAQDTAILEPMPAVSVLIPTYQPNPGFLREALESLRKQSLQDWTALIHDDCSEIDLESMIKPFLADPRFRFERSACRLGIGGNWNACVLRSDAPLVAFLFQDDVWNPDYLQSAVEALTKHPNAGFVSLDHRYESTENMATMPLYQAVRTFRKKNIHSGLHRGKELLQLWIGHELHPNIVGEPSFVVMRRSVMKQAGAFLTDMPQFLDTEYWLRLLTITDWINLDDREYGMFRVHAGGASAMNQEAGEGLYDRLRCFERLIGSLEGESRSAAAAARNNAVQTMIVKFFDRIGSGKKASPKGGGTLVKFCLRHPIVIGIGMYRYFLTGKAAKSTL